MLTITRIEEADYGCEERLPGEPLMVLVTLENEFGSLMQFEVPENWIIMQELEEGDEWPENINDAAMDQKADNQSKWMDKYYLALEEMQD